MNIVNPTSIPPMPMTRSVHAIGQLAAGFRDAEVSLVTNHPGFRSNELAREFHGTRCITSASERNAFAVAWGHAAAGRRAAVALKNVGLNDAADAFLNSLALDLNAGLVVVVFDDTDVEHSQGRLDSRHYQAFLGGAWLEPANLREARTFAREAFELSEKISMPVVLRITNALLAKAGTVASERETPPTPAYSACFVRKPCEQVVHPSNHQRHQQSLRHKRQIIAEWAAACCHQVNPSPRTEAEEVHIIAGAARKPLVSKDASILYIPCLPLPEAWLRHVVGNAHDIHVHEHGDPVVAGILRSILCSQHVRFHETGSLTPNRSYHCRDEMMPLYRFLRSLPSMILVGDLGGFTMDADRSIDMCLCYGASVGVATGAALAGTEAEVFCICGDGAFLHSAKHALDEAVARSCDLLVLVIDNGGCRGTGGQLPPGDTTVGHPAIREEAVRYSPSSPTECLQSINRLRGTPGVKVLHLHTTF